MKGLCNMRKIVLLTVLLSIWTIQTHLILASTGDILGRVTDQTQGVVPGVAVTIRNINTGLNQTTISDDSGGYVFALLPVGEYAITAELSGFKRETVTGIVLQAGQRARVDLTLIVGEVSDEVTVEGMAALVKTDSPDLGVVVDNVKMNELPLNARSFVQLNTLDAGTAERVGNRNSFYNRFGGNFSFQGSPADGNNFLLDNIDIRGQNDTRVAMRVSMDAIQEFKSETNVYSAEGGRGAGAQVKMVTKSGTNNLHGTLFFFHRNDNLDARSFFDRDPLNPQERSNPPEFRQHQFGVTVGGPIVKDRSFFFFSYEGWRIAKGTSQIYSVPSERLRSGDFSHLGSVIYDPATTREDPNNPGSFIRDPFPGNIIPLSRVPQVVTNSLNRFYPLPNLAGETGNLLAAPFSTRDEDLFTGRIDHNFSDSDRFFGRYSGVFDRSIDRTFTNLPNFSDDFEVPAQNLVLSYTRTLSPTSVNELKVGYTRMTQFLQDVEFEEGVLAQVGIEGTNPLFDYNPWLLLAGYNRTGAILNAPNNRSENIYSFVDNLSFKKGSHALGLGVDVRRIQINGGIQSNPSGLFIFNNFYTRFPGDPSTGHPAADFLLGTVQISRTSRGDGFRHHRTSHVGLYLKDDWNATPNLTVNLGLRWEYYQPNVEINNKIANLVDNQLITADQADSFGLPRALFQPDYNNFAPRIGLAYRPFGNNRTVVRLGYGVYYTPQTTFQTMLLGLNPPALEPFLFVGDTNFPNLTLQNAFPVEVGALNFTPWTQDPGYRIGYNQHFSLNVQRELARDLMLEVAYVGNKGTKLRLVRDINKPVPGPGDFASRRPLPEFATINQIDDFGKSIYHGLKVNMEKRFSDGLAFLLSYNWSKVLDEGGLLSMGESNDALGRDPLDPNAERGRSIFDARHRFVFSYVYQLPFGPGQSRGADLTGIAGWLVGGWQLSGITSLQSGGPVNLTAAVDYANTGGGARPDLVGDPHSGPRTPEEWFNTSAFAAPQQYTYGNTGRNILDAPGTANFDIALMKNTYFGEDKRLEFRAEFFNAFNRAHLDPPNGAFGAGSFGQIFGAGFGREIQFGLKFFY